MTLDRHLVIFAKSPKMGTVKTRLAADIGSVAATAFYRHCLTDLMQRLDQDGRWRCWVAVSPDTATAISVHRQPFWPARYAAVKQGPGDMGQRMGHIFRSLPPGPVVLVGADIPAIDAPHINAAFRALGNHDTAFGPTPDGGYWLVGARRCPNVPDLFSGIPWSTDRTLADTLAKLAKAGHTSALLETLEDIDDGTAYRNLLTGVPSNAA